MTSLVDYPVPVSLVPVLESLCALFSDVEDLPDARGLEKRVHEGLREVDQRVMQACVSQKSQHEAQADLREVRCVHCGEWAELLDPVRERTIMSVRGEVRFTRRVFQCSSRDCRHERIPFDEHLGLGPKEHFSPLVQKKVAWAGAMLCSYDKASEDLRHQAELEVSPKQVHRITERIGERALEQQSQEVEQFGRPAAWDHVIEPHEKPETLVLEMDGTCVMGREGEGHEVKCATVFGLDARATTGSEGKERPLLLRRSYCATSEGIQSFRAMVWALCNSWGIRSARRLAIIGDGIDWLWNFSADRFHFNLPDGSVQVPEEILDFYHAAENLSKARNAIYKDPEGKTARNWYDHWRSQIKAGGVESLLKELEGRVKGARSQESREELARRLAYFRKHAHRMRYDQYKAQGLPIGSGAIEGTCKNLVKGRMSCVGQRWSGEGGIERMVALRTRIFNERYEDLWLPLTDRAAA